MSQPHSQSFLLITYRKPGLTMSQFINHYETVHIPLIKSLAGSTFPRRHVRHYVERVPDGPAQPGAPEQRNTNSPATLVQGDIRLMDWDCLTEIEFRDEAHFGAFFAIIGQGEGMEKREADERLFLDTDRITAVKQSGVFATSNP